MKGIELKKYRKDKGLTQQEFAELLKISKRTVINWEKSEKVNPSKVQFILSYFNNGEYKSEINSPYVSEPQEILMQKNDLKQVSEDEVEIFINNNAVKFFIYSDDTIKVEVDMMPFRAYASSNIDAYFDKNYREKEFNKAIFTVDNVAKGLYLGFKSQNESMNGGGIDDTPSGAELLCRELGRHLWKSLHSTEYGFVLMTKSAILHKDITNYNKDTGMFTLHSRNPDEQDFEENINNVYRIFKVVKRTF